MTPMQLEQHMVNTIKPSLIMPTVSFSADPNAVKQIGQDGLCTLLYQGSSTEGKRPQTKRIMQVSVLIYSPSLAKLHENMDAVYSAMKESQIAGCIDSYIVDDAIVRLDSGLYHGEIMVEAVVAG